MTARGQTPGCAARSPRRMRRSGSHHRAVGQFRFVCLHPVAIPKPPMARVMTENLSRDTLVQAGWWRALWGALLKPWIKIKRDPAEPVALLAPDTPVIYVIERNGFSDSLILERACREAGLPSPLAPAPNLGKRRHAMFALRSTGGWFQRRRRDHA